MAFDGRCGIVEIDEENKTVVFDAYKLKKISGTRLAPILGMSSFSTPFKAACELAGLYPGDKANKYIDAGNLLEPVLRDHLASNKGVLYDALGIPAGTPLSVDEPVEKERCGYDHFHDNKVFGGLVDGYISVNGKRDSILEIKTSGARAKWDDGSGGDANVPMEYMLQASLYAELSGLDRIVFLVGFLEEQDYDRAFLWRPCAENTALIVKDKLEMEPYMREAEAWYREYMKNGYTPEWTDRDADVLKYLKAYKRR
ncbi:MAG: YqaJ viral recombinase family protein [Candidatus Methanoplasma sp.]|jgi:predicted phage-related endonuclease|nr:YqaJ viral recombinase family protein [Candidatus Methanoplasma sp.]